MNFGEKVLIFNQSLFLDNATLPPDVKAMNPFQDEHVKKMTGEFYRKFFADKETRYMIMGINPGRFGGGVTGIPFTDPHKLQNNCGIMVEKLSAPELSSDFVYKVIEAFGGTDKFYRKFFITAVSPLGFVMNKNGKEVNYNYYDSKELQEAVRNFIMETLTRQIDFGVNRDVCFCLGTGKNFDYLTKLNHKHQFFKTIIPLDHPRFIMQYRRKRVNEYIIKYVNVFNTIK